MTQATGTTGDEPGLTDQASDRVHDAATTVQDKASELREQGSGRLRDEFDQRSNQAGTQVRSLAGALRRSGSDLESEGNANAARLAGQAAERIDRVGSYLEQKSGDELIRDIEGFARRRPWMLAGIGMLAGVATARFLKASSEQRTRDSSRDGQQWPARQGAPDRNRGSYARELETGPYGAGLPAGTDVPSALSDDPLARDPYAGTR
jgi:hypothetical protein